MTRAEEAGRADAARRAEYAARDAAAKADFEYYAMMDARIKLKAAGGMALPPIPAKFLGTQTDEGVIPPVWGVTDSEVVDAS